MTLLDGDTVIKNMETISRVDLKEKYMEHPTL